jgi:hypothetical protein
MRARLLLRSTCLGFWPLIAVCSTLADEFIAYEVPAGTAGTQAFGGTLGMDFDVLQEIRVTRLGVFDDGSNGLNLAITATLYDRAGPTAIGTLQFAPGDDGELVGGNRFKALEAPIVLAPGFQGSIVAQGYGAAERNGNGLNPPPWTTNDGECAVGFVGSGRWGDPNVFPPNADGGPANRYAAGTFQFEIDPIPAEIVSHTVPAATAGDQAFGGSLGMDFNVREPVDILALGVFDDLSDGLNATITAKLYERNAQSVVATLVFNNAEPGALSGGHRFKDLQRPLFLPAGFQGTIVAEGYGAAERDLNVGAPAVLDTHAGGCLLEFVGSGRWGDAGAFPANVDVGPPGRFGAGSFRYRVAETVVEPPQRPENPSATAGDGSVALSWGPPSAGEEPDAYHVFRTKPGPRTRLTDLAIDTLTFDAVDLVNGAEHCFVVRSVSATGLESVDSDEVCARPTTSAGFGAPHIAFEVPAATVGNQAFGGALGMDFQVNSDAILIRRLGVFDDGSDGLKRPITARLYDRSTGGELAQLAFTPEDAGELIDGSRFKTLPALIELPAGFQGTIVAEGYGADDPATEEVDETELNGNRGAGALPLTTDQAGCAIALAGARFGVNAGVFPPSRDLAGFHDNYAAGTFEYSVQGAGPGQHEGIAYVVPAGTAGVQNFGGSLGLDFNVVDDLRVTRIGVFDSGSDGLGRTLTARLFNRDSRQALATVEFNTAEPGELIGGSRFKDLAEPLCLPAGFHGTIAADGYGPGELAANSGAGQPLVWTTDDGACLLEFVGAGRFGDPGAFPGTPDGGPANRYAAGTFVFGPSGGPCILPPDPPSGVAAAAGDSFVLVTWNPVGPPTPAASFKVFRSVGGGPYELAATVDTTLYLDAGRANGIDVCYTVRSVSADGVESENDSLPICATPGAAVPGRIVAYEVAAGTLGNNETPGQALGLDFDTSLRIRVHRLGVFDDGTNGLKGPLTVSLHNRDNGVELASVDFTPASQGMLIGGHRFKPLAQPLNLPANFHGSIVVEGFGLQDRYRSGEAFPTNPGPCSLSFINSRSGPAGAFPPPPAGAAISIHPFAAGSLEFEPLETEAPGAGGIAHQAPAGRTGNQDFPGALGMDFNVNAKIEITRLGVFDDSSDGLKRPINCRLYNRDTLEVITSMDFTPEDQGELAGGHRLKPLPAPVALDAGFRGSIVASGYGAAERNGNQGGERLGLTTDDGGCLISFVNGGRFGDPAAPLSFPGVPDGGPANRYGAGTFEFRPPCPAEGDTHCLNVALSGPGGNTPGLYTITATASDDSGDDILYTFVIENLLLDGPPQVIGPQLGNSVEVELVAAPYSIRVSVDDAPGCDDVAADASCAPLEIEIIAGGRNVPGDCNADGVLNIADASCVFGVLFLGTPELFPCGDGTPTDPGSRILIDWQGDGRIDLSDGVAGLNFLFNNGPAHRLAVEGDEVRGCVVMPGCPDNADCP